MGEYHNDPSYGKDDYGSWCSYCGDWIPVDWQEFCSLDCETNNKERTNEIASEKREEAEEVQETKKA